MFKKNKELRYLAIGALILSVFGFVISYIAMSTALNIREVNNIWKISFTDLEIETSGDVSSSNLKVEATSINDMEMTFSGNGSITYKFKVKNTGAVDAVLRNINYGRCICAGDSCDNVSYKLTYADGRDVLEGDVVNFDTNMEMHLVVNYEGLGVKIKDFDFIMLYEQV